MGWVAGPRLVAATAEAGGLGILASATMTFPELVAAIGEVRSRTDRPFGVNMRTDVADVGRPGGADDRPRGAGGQLRPGPEARAGGPVPGRRVGGDADHRRPAARREGGGLGCRRRHRPGWRGRRPHRLGPHLAADPGGGGRRGGQGAGDRRRRILRRPRPGGRPGLRGLGHRHGHPLPAHPGEPGPRRGQAGLPRDTGHRHGGVHRGRRRPPTGHPHRARRPPGALRLAADPAPGAGQRPRLPSPDRHLPDRPW